MAFQASLALQLVVDMATPKLFFSSDPEWLLSPAPCPARLWATPGNWFDSSKFPMMVFMSHTSHPASLYQKAMRMVAWTPKQQAVRRPPSPRAKPPFRLHAASSGTLYAIIIKGHGLAPATSTQVPMRDLFLHWSFPFRAAINGHEKAWAGVGEREGKERKKSLGFQLLVNYRKKELAS